MARTSFPAVVTANPDGVPVASHLPVLARSERGELVGHLARANPQAAAFRTGCPEVLVIFTGPSAYVSPTWYAEERAVPTWNHLTVHAYGRPSAIEDEEATLELLRATVARFEEERPVPWRLDTRSVWMRSLARGVLGFRLAVTRVEAQFKLSQNLPDRLRRRAALGLLGAGHAELSAAMLAMDGTR